MNEHTIHAHAIDALAAGPEAYQRYLDAQHSHRCPTCGSDCAAGACRALAELGVEDATYAAQLAADATWQRYVSRGELPPLTATRWEGIGTLVAIVASALLAGIISVSW